MAGDDEDDYDDEDAYVVGYGKPPSSGQFRKGQSGNPKGRPKGSLDFKTYVKEMLSKQVTVTEGGRKRRISSLQATLMRLSEKSLKGDMKAIERILALASDMAEELEAREAGRALGQTDREILERFLESRSAIVDDPSDDLDDGDD